jgi:hypothetical protein
VTDVGFSDFGQNEHCVVFGWSWMEAQDMSGHFLRYFEGGPFTDRLSMPLQIFDGGSLVLPRECSARCAVPFSSSQKGVVRELHDLWYLW